MAQPTQHYIIRIGLVNGHWSNRPEMYQNVWGFRPNASLASTLRDSLQDRDVVIWFLASEDRKNRGARGTIVQMARLVRMNNLRQGPDRIGLDDEEMGWTSAPVPEGGYRWRIQFADIVDILPDQAHDLGLNSRNMVHQYNNGTKLSQSAIIRISPTSALHAYLDFQYQELSQ
jgi:hypothetical protein